MVDSCGPNDALAGTKRRRFSIDGDEPFTLEAYHVDFHRRGVLIDGRAGGEPQVGNNDSAPTQQYATGNPDSPLPQQGLPGGPWYLFDHFSRFPGMTMDQVQDAKRLIGRRLP
jgi:hypothetical protein